MMQPGYRVIYMHDCRTWAGKAPPRACGDLAMSVARAFRPVAEHEVWEMCQQVVNSDARSDMINLGPCLIKGPHPSRFGVLEFE